MVAASKVRIRSTEEERANKELELTKSVPSFALGRRTTAFAAQFRRSDHHWWMRERMSVVGVRAVSPRSAVPQREPGSPAGRGPNKRLQLTVPRGKAAATVGCGPRAQPPAVLPAQRAGQPGAFRRTGPAAEAPCSTDLLTDRFTSRRS